MHKNRLRAVQSGMVVFERCMRSTVVHGSSNLLLFICLTTASENHSDGSRAHERDRYSRLVPLNELKIGRPIDG